MSNQPLNNRVESRPDRTNLAIVVLAILVIVVILVALTFSGFIPRLIQSGNLPASTPAITIIVDQNLTVKPESYVSYDFTAAALVNPAVQGTFNVTSGGTIRVLIMNAANFTEWHTAQNAITIYDSGEVNSGNFNVNVPSTEDYVLVYDNTFSDTPKNVTTQVDAAHF